MSTVVSSTASSSASRTRPADDLVWREMGPPCPQPHGERRAASLLAGDGDLSVMELDELPHECEADADTLAGTAPVDLIEPVEHVRQVIGRNPDA
jgi:hypothetical protein